MRHVTMLRLSLSVPQCGNQKGTKDRETQARWLGDSRHGNKTRQARAQNRVHRGRIGNGFAKLLPPV